MRKERTKDDILIKNEDSGLLGAKEDPTVFDRRFILAVLAVVLVFSGLILKLWLLQVYHGETYADLSKNNRIRLRYTAPLRGRIFDRNGTLLVSNRPSYDVYMDLDEQKKMPAVAERLAPILGMTVDEILARVKSGERDTFFNTVRLKTDISWPQLSEIETQRYDLPGVTIQVEPKREYVYPGLASHIIGFLGEVSKSELEKGELHGVSAGEYVGKSGVERTLGQLLRGRKGGRQVEVDAYGREVRTLNLVSPVPGNDVYLTLDIALQETLQDELEGKAGAIVALRPETGEVLAMASGPTFDQEQFVKGMTQDLWQKIVDDPMKPLQNKAIQGQYPPGSVFKLIMALAGLQEKVINENTVLKCWGRYPFGNRLYHCWKKWGHGSVRLEEAIAESCDIYFYQLGQMLGVDKIAKYAELFGLNNRTDIALDNELPGFIPTSAWKLRRFKVPWQKGETLSLAIGQSFTLVTPLQVARVMAAIANGGRVLQPQLVQKVTTPDGQVIQTFPPVELTHLPFSKANLDLVQHAMMLAVEAPHGTASGARVKGINVAGKTGTVQVVGLKDALNRKKTEDMPYEQRDHAWFACFAPYEHPDIALSIIIEHGGHGGSVAAPIAQRIIKSYLEYNEDAGERLTHEEADRKAEGGA